MRATTQLCGKTAIRENSHKNASLSILGPFEMDASLFKETTAESIHWTSDCCAFWCRMLEMISFRLVCTEMHVCLIAVSSVIICFLLSLFFVPKFDAEVRQRSLHVACEAKVNAHPLLSFSSVIPLSCLCSAIHTSNYRVCDGYYNTDLPG